MRLAIFAWSGRLSSEIGPGLNLIIVPWRVLHCSWVRLASLLSFLDFHFFRNSDNCLQSSFLCFAGVDVDVRAGLEISFASDRDEHSILDDITFY